jgi:tetratricopeptide (TPR) repeat protein
MRSSLLVLFLSFSFPACQRSPARGGLGGAGQLALGPLAGERPLESEIARAQQSVRLAPSDPARWDALAEAYVRAARTLPEPAYNAQARDAVERALQLDPKSLRTRATHAVTLIEDHRFAEAEEIARELVLQAPEELLGWALLADTQTERGEYREAVETVQHLLDASPDQESYSRASHLRWLTGDVEGAIDLMKRAVAHGSVEELDGWNWCTGELGRLYQLTGRLAEARAQFDAVLARNAGDPPALLGRGRVAAAEGRLDAAIADLGAAVAASPLVEMQWALGEALERAGRTAEADAVYAALEKSGERVDPRTFSLYLSTRNRDPARALAIAKRAREERDDVYTSDVLAWALYRNGQLETARQAIARALVLGTRDARMLFHRGAILRALGRRQEAAASLRAALEVNPYFDTRQAAQAHAWLDEDGRPSGARSSPARGAGR